MITTVAKLLNVKVSDIISYNIVNFYYDDYSIWKFITKNQPDQFITFIKSNVQKFHNHFDAIQYIEETIDMEDDLPKEIIHRSLQNRQI